MSKFRVEHAVKNGWSRWVSPLHGNGDKNYKMACCDCGLVHDMQFRIIKEKSGRFSVIFRTRRNKRSTASMRRAKK